MTLASLNTAVPKPMTSHTCSLSPAEIGRLREVLEGRQFEFRDVPYAHFGAVRDTVNVTCYQSGKLVVQGKGTRDFVEFLLEPEVLKRAVLGYEAILDPELLVPRIGVDESGKGDFFGPLCVAGVYVNESVLAGWAEAGVKDSKRITSDKRIAELADVIRKTPGCVVSVVPIGNEAYNRLHRKLGSTNAILAWGHARVIENILADPARTIPPPRRAVSDQFASDKRVVEQALMKSGRQIELVQRHKAEADMAVAAASILARHEFVTRLAALGKANGLVLPKGGGPEADAAALKLVQTSGREGLEKVAKMHFRNACRALGLPEPARTEWKRRGKPSSGPDGEKTR